MLILFQPLLTALVGAALAVFGGVHGVLQWPTSNTWSQVAAMSPMLFTVLVFLGCLVIAACGVAMLWTGIVGTRTRFRQLRRIRWPAPGSSGNQNYRDDPYEDQRW